MARKEFAVFGLGEFGRSVAMTLADHGCDVLAVDDNNDKVQEIAEHVTQALRADLSDPDAIRCLGIKNLDAVVVAIGNNLEASIMCTITAKEMGVPYVMAKANDEVYANILRKVGADEIIYPEKAMGDRTARNLISGNFIDIAELSSEFSLVEITTPKSWVGKTPREMGLLSKGFNIIARKDGEKINVYINPDKELHAGESYIVIGENEALEKL